MKKLIVLFILFVAVLTGCSGITEETPALPAATEIVRIEIDDITPLNLAVPQKTPLPYVSKDTAFTPIPLIDVTPTEEPSIFPSEDPHHEKYIASEGIETVAWMTDTQHYANTFPEIYPVMTSFLRDKAEEMNLVYIVHTGDLVHRNDSIENWEIAKAAMDLIENIPSGVLAGNHDMDPSRGGYKNYWTYFGEKYYRDQECYGESFENNRGHYDLLKISGRDYIFVYMSYAPDKKAIKFILDSFNKFPDRIGVLCLHDYITTEGTISEAGMNLREHVVAKCPNIYMVLCGHRYGLYTLEETFDDDGDGNNERMVYEIMMNYQAAGKEGGGGYLRLMQFDEINHEIHCINYSPYLMDYDWLDDPSHKEKRYEMDEKSESFTIKMPWA